MLQEIGIYRYHHPLDNAAEYRDQLRGLQERIVEVVKGGKAILASDRFTFDNSLAKGRKMTSDFSKLMLRAYNAKDAVTVETELHRTFAAARVNTVNEKREFFFATSEQVRVVLAEKVGNLLEFTLEPEATQYLQSKKYWPSSS